MDIFYEVAVLPTNINTSLKDENNFSAQNDLNLSNSRTKFKKYIEDSSLLKINEIFKNKMNEDGHEEISRNILNKSCPSYRASSVNLNILDNAFSERTNRISSKNLSDIIVEKHDVSELSKVTRRLKFGSESNSEEVHSEAASSVSLKEMLSDSSSADTKENSENWLNQLMNVGGESESEPDFLCQRKDFDPSTLPITSSKDETSEVCVKDAFPKSISSIDEDFIEEIEFESKSDDSVFKVPEVIRIPIPKKLEKSLSNNKLEASKINHNSAEMNLSGLNSRSSSESPLNSIQKSIVEVVLTPEGRHSIADSGFSTYVNATDLTDQTNSPAVGSAQSSLSENVESKLDKPEKPKNLLEEKGTVHGACNANNNRGRLPYDVSKSIHSVCRLDHEEDWFDIMDFQFADLPPGLRNPDIQFQIMDLSQRVVRIGIEKSFSPNTHILKRRAFDPDMYFHSGSGFAFFVCPNYAEIRTHSNLISTAEEAANARVFFDLISTSFTDSTRKYSSSFVATGIAEGFRIDKSKEITEFTCKLPAGAEKYMAMFKRIPMILRDSLFETQSEKELKMRQQNVNQFASRSKAPGVWHQPLWAEEKRKEIRLSGECPYKGIESLAADNKMFPNLYDVDTVTALPNQSPNIKTFESLTNEPQLSQFEKLQRFRVMMDYWGRYDIPEKDLSDEKCAQNVNLNEHKASPICTPHGSRYISNKPVPQEIKEFPIGIYALNNPNNNKNQLSQAKINETNISLGDRYRNNENLFVNQKQFNTRLSEISRNSCGNLNTTKPFVLNNNLNSNVSSGEIRELFSNMLNQNINTFHQDSMMANRTISFPDNKPYYKSNFINNQNQICNSQPLQNLQNSLHSCHQEKHLNQNGIVTCQQFEQSMKEEHEKSTDNVNNFQMNNRRIIVEEHQNTLKNELLYRKLALGRDIEDNEAFLHLGKHESDQFNLKYGPPYPIQPDAMHPNCVQNKPNINSNFQHYVSNENYEKIRKQNFENEMYQTKKMAHRNEENKLSQIKFQRNKDCKLPFHDPNSTNFAPKHMPCNQNSQLQNQPLEQKKLGSNEHNQNKRCENINTATNAKKLNRGEDTELISSWEQEQYAHTFEPQEKKNVKNEWMHREFSEINSEFRNIFSKDSLNKPFNERRNVPVTHLSFDMDYSEPPKIRNRNIPECSEEKYTYLRHEYLYNGYNVCRGNHLPISFYFPDEFMEWNYYKLPEPSDMEELYNITETYLNDHRLQDLINGSYKKPVASWERKFVPEKDFDKLSSSLKNVGALQPDSNTCYEQSFYETMLKGVKSSNVFYDMNIQDNCSGGFSSLIVSPSIENNGFEMFERMAENILEYNSGKSKGIENNEYVDYGPACCSKITEPSDPPMAILIFYSHDGTKVVSIGMFSRHFHVGKDLYDTKTCTGACGAPVFAINQSSFTPYVTSLVHAGIDVDLNYGVGLSYSSQSINCYTQADNIECDKNPIY